METIKSFVHYFYRQLRSQILLLALHTIPSGRHPGLAISIIDLSISVIASYNLRRNSYTQALAASPWAFTTVTGYSNENVQQQQGIARETACHVNDLSIYIDGVSPFQHLYPSVESKLHGQSPPATGMACMDHGRHYLTLTPTSKRKHIPCQHRRRFDLVRR